MLRVAGSQLIYHRALAAAQMVSIAIVIAIAAALALVDAGAANAGYRSVVLAGTTSNTVDIETTAVGLGRDFLGV